jgi:hypothetical protein
MIEALAKIAEGLASLMDELASRSVNLRSSRDELRLLLLDYQ